MKATKEQIKLLHVLYSHIGLSDDSKKEMLLGFTSGRTESTAELTEVEARNLIRNLGEQRRDDVQKAQRKLRSGALKRMQQLGVDTTNWKAVNAYCQQPRIAGKTFYALSNEDLSSLTRKLESIKKKLDESED